MVVDSDYLWLMMVYLWASGDSILYGPIIDLCRLIVMCGWLWLYCDYIVIDMIIFGLV